jgi:hypothetical protein
MQPPEVTHTARSPARGANTSRSRAVSSQAFAYSGRPSPLIRAPLDGILSFFVEKSTPRAVAPLRRQVDRMTAADEGGRALRDVKRELTVYEDADP